MLSFSISYWDLIKFHYFVDTTERGHRGWKQVQRQGDFTVNSIVWYILQPCAWQCRFHIRLILSSPLGPLLVNPSCQCFCHRVLEFLPFVLVAWYGFFIFICFVVYAYVFDTWSLVFRPLASSCHLMSPTCSWSTH